LAKDGFNFSGLKPFVRSKSVSKPTDLETEKFQKFLEAQGAKDVFQSNLQPENVIVRIHKVASLDFDNHMISAFQEINRLRESQGKKPYFANPRYRVIKCPYLRDDHYIIDVGEADFAHVALLVEPEVPLSIKSYVREKIQHRASKMPKYLRTDDLLLNGLTEGQLGIQMVLVTTDGYTLLRKRGQSVLEYGGAWDVSFSGYCGQNQLRPGRRNQLGVERTAQFELEREIGLMGADPRFIEFTALHVNPLTGTTVLTGYWQIQEKRNDLAKYLNKKYPKAATVFETTELANEVYVWDNKNILVEFSGPVIAQALTQAEHLLGNGQFVMVPAAYTALLSALRSLGKSTKGLASI
jgi:hypothetical protein